MDKNYKQKNGHSFFNLELNDEEAFEDEDLFQDYDLSTNEKSNGQDFDSYIFNKLEELNAMRTVLYKILDNLTQKQVKSTVF